MPASRLPPGRRIPGAVALPSTPAVTTAVTRHASSVSRDDRRVVHVRGRAHHRCRVRRRRQPRRRRARDTPPMPTSVDDAMAFVMAGAFAALVIQEVAGRGPTWPPLRGGRAEHAVRGQSARRPENVRTPQRRTSARSQQYFPMHCSLDPACFSQTQTRTDRVRARSNQSASRRSDRPSIATPAPARRTPPRRRPAFSSAPCR